MSNRQFPTFVDLPKVTIIEDRENNFRYKISIPFQFAVPRKSKKALVIMKNPSKARIDHIMKIYHSDTTADRVLNYLYRKSFTEVIIVNLFATYETYAENLNKLVNEPNKLIGIQNDTIIQDCIKELEENDIILVAWGGYPKDSSKEMKIIYHERINKVESLINKKNVKYVDRLVKNKKFPLHGLQWAYDQELYDYLIQKNSIK
ncbi:DUF1643 domain-containing protein [Gottfriedia acidiceleris]|uniref:DUF1643 domain-containing protein n=1 Tax=Gottfriedia acidiceleris TaxID=371036 RepID=A0ABY4JRA8_9BACI|nr:DUF1643 domain-containing protein [Gottfriedia acidiceleris]UPM56374.1 DUF1643 domain-containing protein [Gottfriedia acidiceleris]